MLKVLFRYGGILYHQGICFGFKGLKLFMKQRDR